MFKEYHQPFCKVYPQQIIAGIKKTLRVKAYWLSELCNSVTPTFSTDTSPEYIAFWERSRRTENTEEAMSCLYSIIKILYDRIT